MRAVLGSTVLLIGVWGVLSFYLPSLPSKGTPFLSTGRLQIFNQLDGKILSELQADCLTSQDAVFSTWQATDVIFQLDQGEECIKGKIGDLTHDSVTSRTTLSQGVEIYQTNSMVSLLGESFVWDSNRWTLEASEGVLARFAWGENNLMGYGLVWNQGKQALSLSQGVQGAFHATP